MAETKHHHLGLIFDISELAHMISDSEDIDGFLSQTVQRVAEHLKADVGSIYLLDEQTDELVLKATMGLNPQSVDSIRMKIGEGLVGVTMANMQPVCDGAACNNPNFKYFAEAHEEPYKSFLSVPICRGAEKIGVLVVQHEQPDYFDHADIMGMRAIASQLAGTIANARMLIAMRNQIKLPASKSTEDNLRFFRAEAAAPGFAMAPAVPLKPVDPLFAGVPEDEFHNSLKDFHLAVQATVRQLNDFQEHLVRRLPESAALIFEAHNMIMKDPRFSEKIAALIRKGESAAAATREVARHFIAQFENSPSPYLREKSQDIQDLVHRILFNLKKHKDASRSRLDAHIVIAPQLYPSDVLKLAAESVAGIILVSGGVTSHVAILARSIKMPLIIANRKELLQVPEGRLVLMDAEVGTIYIEPSAHILQKYKQRDLARTRTAGKAVAMKPGTVTADGTRVHLMANINLLSELDMARELKAEGIGLYRSEFPFMVRSVFPTEEEQRVVYRRLFDQMAGQPVHIRTLDIGGDKILPYSGINHEPNPELGLRSIRFSLKHRDIFDQQIRAILRAGAHSQHLGIMFPMISSVDEFQTARQIVYDVVAELGRQKLDHNAHPSIGAMIELPAIVDILDDLALLADFFSIGTNDFIQYMLAVDRTNESVSGYYQPYHPGILRSLERIVKSAVKHSKPISVCGELAHDTKFIPFLIGIGIRRLSLDPQFLPAVQDTLSLLHVAEAEKYAKALLACSTIEATTQLLSSWPMLAR